MDKQKFIDYINNELGLDINETAPAYPYVEELYEALLPYEKELKAGTYRLLSSDNYEDCYDDFSNKIADIDAPHWFDITVYRAPQNYKYFVEFSDELSSDVYFAQSILFNTKEEALDWARKIEFIRFNEYSVYLMKVPVNEEGDIDGDILQVKKLTFENTALNYNRINKSEARKLYNLGKPIMILPCNANPNSPWFSNSMISKESGRDFDALVNEFIYYNCNTSELGRYPAFYVVAINE